MDSEQEAYAELGCYTLAHRDSAFIHQLVAGRYYRIGRFRSVVVGAADPSMKIIARGLFASPLIA